MYTKYKIVPFCSYHFVRTILSNTILSVYHFVHTILSATILSGHRQQVVNFTYLTWNVLLQIWGGVMFMRRIAQSEYVLWGKCPRVNVPSSSMHISVWKEFYRQILKWILLTYRIILNSWNLRYDKIHDIYKHHLRVICTVVIVCLNVAMWLITNCFLSLSFFLVFTVLYH